MTQNIYDQDAFFQGYAKLPRSIRGLDAAPERPCIREQLPRPLGHVVDLGCGYGWFARWAQTNGAKSVLAFDVSEKMIARARAKTTSQAITYEVQDLETLTLPAGSYDLAYSSLALHYIADLERLVGVIAQSIVPGGKFVFSIEHPLFTAPTTADWWVHPGGQTVWPLDAYLDESERVRDWLAPGVIKYHRTHATYLNTLVEHRLHLTRIVEWGPSLADLAEHPDWANDRQRPPFLIVAAQRVS